jgi:hypothetical protein
MVVFDGAAEPEKIINNNGSVWRHAVKQSIEALRYKPAGLGFNSRWRHWNFSLI